MFISCLFIINSCSTDDTLIEITQKEEKKAFASFSEENNKSYKTSNIDYQYALKFSYLLQRYDSLHNTNVSGLVNSINTVKYNKLTKQNFIIENKDFYVETRMYSKLVEESNGNKWIVFPKIQNNRISSFLIGLLSKNKTEVNFYTFDDNSDFYKNNITAYQDRYNTIINSSKQNKTSSGGFDCGTDDLEPCNLEGPIITPNPGSGGPIWPGGGGETGGGGCEIYQDCDNTYNPDSGGDNGSSSNPCPKNPLKTINIASSGASGKNGGRYGYTRNGNKKFHDGLDLASSPGTDLYSMHSGYVSDIRNSFENGEYKANSYGNYIEITSTINGETITIKYNHLNKNTNPMKTGDAVSAGQLIGKTGSTGNAAANGVTPHVHIQTKKNGNKTNPESYIGAKFDSNGNTVSDGCK